MTWYGDMSFQAATEFPVAEKESVTNIHKWLKTYTVSMLLIKALLITGFWKLQIMRGAKSTDVCQSGWPTTAVIQAQLQCADSK
jgi:hypothetical protein